MLRLAAVLRRNGGAPKRGRVSLRHLSEAIHIGSSDPAFFGLPELVRQVQCSSEEMDHIFNRAKADGCSDISWAELVYYVDTLSKQTINAAPTPISCGTKSTQPWTQQSLPQPVTPPPSQPPSQSPSHPSTPRNHTPPRDRGPEATLASLKFPSRQHPTQNASPWAKYSAREVCQPIGRVKSPTPSQRGPSRSVTPSATPPGSRPRSPRTRTGAVVARKKAKDILEEGVDSMLRLEDWVNSMKAKSIHFGVLEYHEDSLPVCRLCFLYSDRLEAFDLPLREVNQAPTKQLWLRHVETVEVVHQGFILKCDYGAWVGLHVVHEEDHAPWSSGLHMAVFDLKTNFYPELRRAVSPGRPPVQFALQVKGRSPTPGMGISPGWPAKQPSPEARHGSPASRPRMASPLGRPRIPSGYTLDTSRTR